MFGQKRRANFSSMTTTLGMSALSRRFSGGRQSGCVRKRRLPSLGSQSNLPITSELTTAEVLARHTESFMNSLTRQPRFQLDRVSFRELRRQVLRRDGWRCQICGRAENLDVHHHKRRSALGDDSQTNLITLCRECHQTQHSRRNGRSSAK